MKLSMVKYKTQVKICFECQPLKVALMSVLSLKSLKVIEQKLFNILK